MYAWNIMEILISLASLIGHPKETKLMYKKNSQRKEPKAFVSTWKFPSKVYKETFLIPESISKGPQAGKHGGV